MASSSSPLPFLPAEDVFTPTTSSCPRYLGRVGSIFREQKVRRHTVARKGSGEFMAQEVATPKAPGGMSQVSPSEQLQTKLLGIEVLALLVGM